jgi:hypothetical protein
MHSAVCSAGSGSFILLQLFKRELRTRFNVQYGIMHSILFTVSGDFPSRNFMICQQKGCQGPRWCKNSVQFSDQSHVNNAYVRNSVEFRIHSWAILRNIEPFPSQFLISAVSILMSVSSWIPLSASLWPLALVACAYRLPHSHSA